MDEIDVLLKDLAREEVPAESLRRVAAGVHAKLRRRRFTHWALAAAAMLAAWYVSAYSVGMTPTETLKPPKAIEAAFPAPEAIIASPKLVPSVSHQWQQRSVGRVVGDGVVELPSSDPNVVILWDMKQEEESGGLR